MFSPTFKSYNINLDTRNEGNTVYSGDILTGQVSFEITKTIKITSITMLMKGIVHVHWTSGSRKHRRHHSEKRQFFNFNNVILNEGNGMHRSEASRCCNQSLLVDKITSFFFFWQFPVRQQNFHLESICIRLHVSSLMGVYELLYLSVPETLK